MNAKGFVGQFALAVHVSNVISTTLSEADFVNEEDPNPRLIAELKKEFPNLVTNSDQGFINQKYEEWSRQSPAQSLYLSRSEYIASAIVAKSL